MIIIGVLQRLILSCCRGRRVTFQGAGIFGRDGIKFLRKVTAGHTNVVIFLGIDY